MNSIKQDFPLLQNRTIHGLPIVYLDNASTTQKPQMVIDAMVDFYKNYNANIHRGIYTLAEEATSRYEAVRTQVAQFIGARSAHEIVFTRGTTESINVVASSWAAHMLQPGDEIILTQMEHHANLLPWQQLAHAKGFILKFIPVLPNGTLDYALLDTLITAKTKLVSVVHISHVLGTHNAISTIIEKAHAVGAKVLIDAAQSVPHQAIDIHAMDCDFLVFSGHKMMGPTGVGVLYVKRDLHDHIQPYQYGGGMVLSASYTSAQWQKMPHRLEAGTQALAQVIGLGAALDYLKHNRIFSWLSGHTAALCAQLIHGLSGMPKVRVFGPISELMLRGHVVSFLVEGIHAHDVAAYLDRYGICVRAGNHCAQPFAQHMGLDASVRVSFYAYNTQQDVDFLLHALKELLT